MAIPLKYATADQNVPLGYFVDSTGGNSAETALTMSSEDIILWKSGASAGVAKNSGGATHMTAGLYFCTFDDTDTNTYGPMVVFAHPTGALAVRLECHVMEGGAFDALYAASGSGYIGADVRQILGLAVDPTSAQVGANVVQLVGGTQSATDLKDFADDGYDPSTDRVLGVASVDTTAVNTDMPASAATITAILADTAAIASAQTDITAILSDTNAILVDTAAIASAQTDITSILSDTNAILVDTTAIASAQTDITSILSDTNAILVDTAAIASAQTDITSILSDTNAILVDTAAIASAQTDITSILTDTAAIASAQTDITSILSDTNAILVDTAAIASAQTDITAILVDTSAIASAQVDITAILVDTAAMSTVVHAQVADIVPSAATINAQVVDAIYTDTYAEPGQGAPPATGSLVTKVNYIYKFARNKIETTSATASIYDDAGTTVDQKATISDDGTTFTRGEIGTGP